MEATTKKLLIFVGAGCATLAIMTCVLSAAGLYYCKSSWDVTDATALTFLSTVQRGDFQKAYEQTTPAYRRAHDLNAFRRTLDDNPALLHHSAAHISQHFFEPGRALIGGQLATPAGAKPFYVQLEKAHGQWAVAQFGERAPPPH